MRVRVKGEGEAHHRDTERHDKPRLRVELHAVRVAHVDAVGQSAMHHKHRGGDTDVHRHEKKLRCIEAHAARDAGSLR